MLEQLWTGFTRLSQKCQSKKAESKIGKLSFCFFLGGPPRSDLSPMTKTTVSQSPIPLIFLLYKACPSLTSVPEGRLSSALHRWSLKQLCHHIVWCTVAAGDRAICQGRNSLKIDMNSVTCIYAEEIRARVEFQPRYSSFHKIKMQRLLGLMALASSEHGDSRGFEVGLRSVLCRHHTPQCWNPLRWWLQTSGYVKEGEGGTSIWSLLSLFLLSWPPWVTFTCAHDWDQSWVRKINILKHLYIDPPLKSLGEHLSDNQIPSTFVVHEYPQIPGLVLATVQSSSTLVLGSVTSLALLPS